MPFSTPDYEIVRGDRILEIFDHLLRNKSLVKITADGIDIAPLVMIEAIQKKKDGFNFAIGNTDELIEELPGKSLTRLNFEFFGPDQLPYHCKAPLTAITEKQIHLSGPDHLRRYQLRRNFRIEAPHGAELVVTIDDTTLKMAIVNISLGGVYCHCMKELKRIVKANPCVEDINLKFTYKDVCHQVRVKSAEIRRFEDGKGSKNLGIAYEFKNIHQREKKKLIDQIYALQREFLRNRIR